jgi:bacterioferritin
MIEEYAREHIYLETQHIGEVDKMLRKPGDIEPFRAALRERARVELR